MRSAPFYNFILEATLAGGLMILLAIPLRRLLRGRVHARVFRAAWGLIALRLLLPLSYPNPLMNDLRPTLSVNFAVRPIADQVRVRLTDAAIDLGYAMVGTDYEALQSNLPWRVGLSLEYGKLGLWAMYAYFGAALCVLAVLTVRRLRKRPREGLCGVVCDLCRAAHWFNPLVWVGARLALADTARARTEGKEKLTATAAAFLALACVATALSFATGETASRPATAAVEYPTLEVRQIELAQRRDVPDEAAAERFFRELLVNPYLGLNAENAAVTVDLSGEKWVAWGTLADGSRLSAVFTQRGVVTAYNNEYVIGGVTRPSDDPYLDSEARSMGYCGYVFDFAYSTLPGASFEAVAIVADVTNAHGRFLRLSTGNIFTPEAHSFVLQISPEVRVLSFRLLGDESLCIEGE